LMDIRMPVLNGFKATEKIRELDRSDAASVPIIAMTANAFDDDKKAALDCGMDAHMTKPIDPAILYATLAEFLNKSPNGRTLATSPSPYNKEENHEPI
ncbi:MAG: response regulator, partial [Oscillospiraceae bacterium]